MYNTISNTRVFTLLLIGLFVHTLPGFAYSNPQDSIYAADEVLKIVKSTCPKSESTCEGSCEWSDGSIYEGSFRFGMPNGYGEMNWPNGSHYEGQFEKGYRHGKGTQILDNGDQYIGQFRHGYMSGRGTYIWANGTVYKGEYDKDHLQGYGVIQFSNGDSYEGEWKNSVAEGKGTFTFAAGVRFSGSYKKGKRAGQGRLTWVDGTVFNGDWVNGLLKGKSTFKFKNGDTFKANWKNGQLANSSAYCSAKAEQVTSGNLGAIAKKLSATEKINIAIVYTALAVEAHFNKQYEKAADHLDKALGLIKKDAALYETVDQLLLVVEQKMNQ